MTTNHYKDYFKKRFNYELIEDPHGFIFYTVNGNVCHLAEVFVEPSKRRLGIATELADKLKIMAQEHKCEWITCDTVLGGEDTQSIYSALSYGFKPVQAHNNTITYAMRIGGIDG